MSKRGRGRQRCPPGSVAADRSPPVTRGPLSAGRRRSLLPEDTRGRKWVSVSMMRANQAAKTQATPHVGAVACPSVLREAPILCKGCQMLHNKPDKPAEIMSLTLKLY